METYTTPNLNTFLQLPDTEIAPVVPSSVVYTMGGTRRAAAIAGIKPESSDYIHWTREKMVQGVSLLFQFGVQHVFIMAITPDNYRESGTYRQRLIDFTDWGIAGPEALADYARLDWRVRLLGSEEIPELQPTAECLRQHTAAQSSHTLWCLAVPDEETPWHQILQTSAQTRQSAIQTIYGEDIPLITMFLSTGKPSFDLNLLPPLLVGKVQCYWRQQPGHSLTEQEWRTILYDYAYTRATWRQNKEGRAEQAVAYLDTWQKAPTLGIGTRLGPFWYPASIPSLEDADAHD
jgi:hypothetical protein